MKLSFLLFIFLTVFAAACDNQGQGTMEQQRAEERGDENRLAPGAENPQEAAEATEQ